VLHLWDLGYRLDGDPAKPVYLGTVDRETERPRHLYELVTLPPGAGDFSAAANGLTIDLEGERLLVRRKGRAPTPPSQPERAWDGSTVLLPPPSD